MPEILEQAIGFDRLWLLLLAGFVAGIVRGFSGFGTAMIFMPMSALVLEPLQAILVMIVFDFFAPLLLVPRALKDGEVKDVGLLVLGAVVGVPIGLSLLARMDPELFRWIVSFASLLLLTLLVSGWRYRNPLNSIATVFVGWCGGMLGGIAGLAGPPVILSYMSSPRKPAAIRANTLLFLLLSEVIFLFVYLIKGLLVALPVVLGLLIAVPSTIGGLIGQRLFRPELEQTYRVFAYLVIAASAIAGLPLWD